MTTDVLLDTNILLYAISGNDAEKNEREIAHYFIAQENWGTSVQVLQEFYVNATGKLRETLPEMETMRFIQDLMRRPIVSMSPTLFLRAVVLKNRYRISYWDSAIIAAAETLNCRTLLTQDLNSGQDYDGVRAVDPFTE